MESYRELRARKVGFHLSGLENSYYRLIIKYLRPDKICQVFCPVHGTPGILSGTCQAFVRYLSGLCQVLILLIIN
jgi:hypothetical protein